MWAYDWTRFLWKQNPLLKTTTPTIQQVTRATPAKGFLIKRRSTKTDSVFPPNNHSSNTHSINSSWVQIALSNIQRCRNYASEKFETIEQRTSFQIITLIIKNFRISDSRNSLKLTPLDPYLTRLFHLPELHHFRLNTVGCLSRVCVSGVLNETIIYYYSNFTNRSREQSFDCKTDTVTWFD